jgi:hypothetical protein
LNFEFLCMFADLVGDEQQLDNLFMHIDKEMNLLEKVVVLEEFFIEHVFVDLEYNEEIVVTI